MGPGCQHHCQPMPLPSWPSRAVLQSPHIKPPGAVVLTGHYFILCLFRPATILPEPPGAVVLTGHYFILCLFRPATILPESPLPPSSTALRATPPHPSCPCWAVLEFRTERWASSPGVPAERHRPRSTVEPLWRGNWNISWNDSICKTIFIVTLVSIANENNCGYECSRSFPFHMSVQKRIESLDPSDTLVCSK
jgi:hypothetical protein